MKLDAEVGVVGLGTVGSMTLWRLAAKGVSAIGFESRNIGHDRTGAGGDTRWFRTSLLEPFSAAYVRLAGSLYRELEACTRWQLLHVTGGLFFGHADSAFLRAAGTLASLDRLETVPHEDLRVRYPQHNIDPMDVALWDKHSGYIRSEHSVVAAVQAAVSFGARAYDYSPVGAVEQHDGYVAIHSQDRVFRVRRAVVTLGAWTHKVINVSFAGPDVRRMLLMWFPAPDPTRFHPSVFPTWAVQLPDESMAFGIPTVDNGTVKVAVVESYGEFQDPETLDYSVRPSELTRATDLVRSRFDGLTPTAVRASVHMDLHTSDMEPVVDFAPDAPDVFVAAGFSGKGFKYAPAVGEAAARAVAGDDSLLTPEWSAARFALARQPELT